MDQDDEIIEKTGIRAVLESNVESNERLPMLEVVCERTVRRFATTMRNMTSDAIDVSLVSVRSVRFGDYINRIAQPVMLSVFRVAKWDKLGLVVVDENLIYAVVDALLGGGKGRLAMAGDGRRFTSIEMKLVSKVAQLALDDFCQAFEAIETIGAEVERTEISPRFAAIGSPTSMAAIATFNVDLGDRSGKFSLVLPYVMLEPVRERLLQRFVGEKLGRDDVWEHHIANELWETSVSVDVVLGEVVMRLADVQNFEVGQHIQIGVDPNGRVPIQCGGVTLGEVHLGNRNGNIAVRLVSEISPEKMS